MNIEINIEDVHCAELAFIWLTLKLTAKTKVDIFAVFFHGMSDDVNFRTDET